MVIEMDVQVGLGVAVEYALELGMPQIWKRIHHLAAQLRRKLQEQLPSITLHDRGRLLCGIVSFTMVRSQCLRLFSLLPYR